VLAAEVVVSPEGELSEELRNAAHDTRTAPGRTTTRSQLQEDINAIFATGSDVQPEDTLGAWCFVVQPNPVLRDVQANAGINVPSVLPEGVVDEIFRAVWQHPNLRRFQEGIKLKQVVSRQWLCVGR